MATERGAAQTPARRALAAARSWFTVAAIFSFGTNLLMLAVPLYSLQVFDRVLSSGHVETLVFLTVIAAFGLMILGALDGLRSALLARVGTRFERQVAASLIETGVYGGGTGAPSGGQALRELGTVRSFVGGPSIGPIFDAPWVPFFIVILWLLHWMLGLTALLSALVLFAFAIANDRLLRKPVQEAGKRQIAAQRQADAALRSAETVRAMGMLPDLLARWRRDQEEALLGQEKGADRSAVISGITKFVRLFVQSLMLGIGAYLVLLGELTGGGMIAGTMLLSRALAPVEQAIGAWRQMIAARASFAAVEAALNAAPQRPTGLKLPDPTGAIAIERLTFAPPGSKTPILKRVHFAVDAGEMIGIVGPSASGKSTLCRMIVGIWRPNDGAVRLDGADLQQWTPEALGPHIGYLPQVVDVFSGTVAENISRMGQASSESVIEAAKLAGVHDMILRLPQGYDTPIGDGGLPLSGGQRQRVGLARAVFGNPKLIVLDEPNANLDTEGEAALLVALAALKARGITIVMVAHRPQVLTEADRVLVMRDGEVALLGPRTEVLARLTGAAPAPPRLAAAATG